MLWKILIVASSPMRILDQGRTITAPVDYEGILKTVGTSCLPLALTVTFKCRLRPDSVVVQITEPLAGTASCQGLKGGKPPLDSRETAAAAAAAAGGCADKPAPARARGGGRLKREIIYTIVIELEGVLCKTSGCGKFAAFRRASLAGAAGNK
jgi:hypothetical protein